jgi:tetratricopeptide (TPR) repeat protein
MGDDPRTIRIFISSPGDVEAEREKARQVIESLQRQYADVVLQPVLWEEFALPATASFQETIDYLLDRQPIDIAVFILWSRLGSPLGPASVRSDGTPYRSGTEREFDLMLTAFEQSGKERPIILAYARDDDAGFRQRVACSESSDLEELVAQRKLAESFIQEQFYDAQGRNIRAFCSYREPVGFAQRLRMHLRQALDSILGTGAAPSWAEEPYRGLEVFNIEHATIFFGRDEETCDLLERLRQQETAGCAFAVIVGASGSGKSSLARAGVAASLIQQNWDDKHWRVGFFLPSLHTHDLCGGLLATVANAVPELRDATASMDDVVKALTRDARLAVQLSIAPTIGRAARDGRPVKLLLVVDQMEELWTDGRITGEDRQKFLDAVEAFASCGCITVLATLRSDFYGHAQKSSVFLRLKGERGHYDLLPPDAAALQRLITEPARLAGLRFERNEQTGRTLDERILQDAARDPVGLPLLQYTLAELYHRRQQDCRLLTFAAYDELGGVEGALGRCADVVLRDLSDAARVALPEILALLVTMDVDGEQTAVRRWASLDELTATPARKTLTDTLIDARLLTTDREGDTPVASFAHEALLRRAEPIAAWARQNREYLRLRARVEQSLQRWEQQDLDDSLFLPPGLPLEEGRELLTNAPHLLNEAAASFIRTSIAFHEREATRRRRLRRVAIIMGVINVVAILITFVAIIAINNWHEAELLRQLADSARHKAEVAKERAESAQYEAEVAKIRAESARHEAESAKLTSKQRFEQVKRSNAVLVRMFEQITDSIDDLDPRKVVGALVEATRSLRGQTAGDPLSAARVNHQLGCALRAAGRAEEAIPCFEYAAETRSEELGNGNIDTIDSYAELAYAYYHAGRTDDARRQFERVLALSESHLGINDQKTLACRNGLAGVYSVLGEYEKAIKLQEETLGRCKEVLGAEDSYTLLVMGDLAACYRAAGRLDKAIKLYEETVRLLDTFEPGKRSTLFRKSSLAECYGQSGRLKDAISLFEEIFPIQEESLSLGHPNTADTAWRLAQAYQDDRQLDKATALLQRTVDWMKGNLGPSHRTTLAFTLKLAEVLCDARDGERAAQFYREYFEVQLTGTTSDKETVAAELAKAARNLLKVQQYADAETYARGCLATWQESQPNDWNTFHVKSVLGASLLGQQRFTDAEPFLLTAYDGLQQRQATIPAESRGCLVECVERLVAVYDGLEKPDEAAKWRETLSALENAAAADGD